MTIYLRQHENININFEILLYKNEAAFFSGLNYVPFQISIVWLYILEINIFSRVYMGKILYQNEYSKYAVKLKFQFWNWKKSMCDSGNILIWAKKYIGRKIDFHNFIFFCSLLGWCEANDFLKRDMKSYFEFCDDWGGRGREFCMFIYSSWKFNHSMLLKMAVKRFHAVSDNFENP